MELIPIVDENLKIKGFAEKRWAEKNRLCHLTVLLIPVRCEDHKVAVQIRPKGASYAGRHDFFGGHVSLDKEFWGLLLGEEVDVTSLVWSTAMREANEELQVTRADCYPEIITEQHLTIIGKIGDFPWNGIHNVERSTLFLVKIPKGCSIHPMEGAGGRSVRVKTEFFSLYEVMDKFEDHWDFADGAERILLRFKEDRLLFEEIVQKIESL
ncbi:MAG: hypothetical protein AYK19_05725 [Theionarchaea archaeon DG-70-1]|nr:MAG: hypothetical protein AYK19_05725 [Theionarchaea archaeon DG-70-1]